MGFLFQVTVCCKRTGYHSGVVHQQIKDTTYFSVLFAILGRGPIELGSGNMAPGKQSQS